MEPLEARFLKSDSNVAGRKLVPNKKGLGPSQPEQKSFQSVNAQNMVDLCRINIFRLVATNVLRILSGRDH